jgi:hypothetical protein
MYTPAYARIYADTGTPVFIHAHTRNGVKCLHAVEKRREVGGGMSLSGLEKLPHSVLSALRSGQGYLLFILANDVFKT